MIVSIELTASNTICFNLFSQKGKPFKLRFPWWKILLRGAQKNACVRVQVHKRVSCKKAAHGCNETVCERGRKSLKDRERERVYKLVGEKKRTSGVWAREYEWSYSSANSLSATMTFQFSCCPSVNNVAQNLNTLNSAQDQPLAIGLKVYKATGMNLLLSCWSMPKRDVLVRQTMGTSQTCC